MTFIDGLSIPFFNIGINVSQNATLTRTLTNRLGTYPEWLLGTSRNPTTPQQPTVLSSSERSDIGPGMRKEREDKTVAVAIDIYAPGDVEQGLRNAEVDLESSSSLPVVSQSRGASPNSSPPNSPTPGVVEELREVTHPETSKSPRVVRFPEARMRSTSTLHLQSLAAAQSDLTRSKSPVSHHSKS